MNSNNVRVQSKLSEVLKDFVSFFQFSKEQEQKFFKELEGAIILNAIGKIIDQAPEDEQETIKQHEFKTTEELFTFLGTFVSKEDLEKTLDKSIREVTERLLQKL
ncbi:hypothetical protein KKC60_04880 [Patescibacteria group bacterium]|nr:hypothetical protein [Patescibacteria group bacterium]